jgi:hypothetical protein
MRFKLYYGKIDQDGETPLLTFKSRRQRKLFILDKLLDTRGEKVFVLVIDYGGGLNSVYVFDKWHCIRFLETDSFGSEHYTFSLYEYESYQDAYKVALDMKEESPLCYAK